MPQASLPHRTPVSSRPQVIINGKLDPPDQYSQYSGYAHLGAGLTVGMSSLAAGPSRDCRTPNKCAPFWSFHLPLSTCIPALLWAP